MINSQQFSYLEVQDSFGMVDSVPKLPIELVCLGRSVSGVGLLDTGSSVNVLPHRMGLDLGLVWDDLTMAVTLSGNLAAIEARGVLINAIVGDFEAVRLVFAWCRSDNVPLLLGRMNFFAEFDVCFEQRRLMFEIRRP
jgi:hypothetical protein